MKSKILSIIVFISLMFSVCVYAEFFPDIIITSPNGIWTDSRAYSTLQDAIDAVGADDREIVIVNEQSVTDLTVPSNIRLKFFRDGSINNSGQLTINTRNISADDRQIFTGSGDIDFVSGSVVRSSWFSDIIEVLDVTDDDSLTLIISKSDNVDSNCTVGDDVSLTWESANNVISVNFGCILSNIKDVNAGEFQLFAGAGDFDFLPGTVLKSSWFIRLRNLINYVGTDKVDVEVARTETVDLNATTNQNTTLRVTQGGFISPDAGVVFRINGCFDAGFYRVFTGAGTIILSTDSIAGITSMHYPQWSGATGLPLLVGAPTEDQSIATKKYVDDNSGSGSGDGNVTGPASSINDAIVLFNGTNGTAIKDSTRTIEDNMTDGSNIPDGHAIREYGNANWQTGSGDVLGPATHTIYYVPQWNGTPNSKTLIEGFDISDQGKNLVDDITASDQRATLDLGTVATYDVEAAYMGNDINVPTGAAIIAYGNANWGGAGSPETYTIIAMGQSNMVGYSGTGGDKTTDARVTAWNGAAWVTADLYQLPFILGSTPGNNNIAFHFAKQLAEERGCNVKIILEAENGRPISDWVPAVAVHYAGMRNQITDSGTIKVDFVLWHQGESDNLRSYAAYGADLNTLCVQLRAEPEISVTVPIIMNELLAGGPYSHQNYVFERIANYVSDPFVNVAKAKFLPNVGDLVHLTGEALVSSGRARFHTALRTMTGMAAGHKGSADVININECADKINNANLEVYDDLIVIANGNARVRRYANQIISHGTWTRVQYNLEDWDLGNNFLSYRFTATETGYYHVIVQCMYNTLSANSPLTIIAIYKNSVRTGIEDSTYGVYGAYVDIQASGIIQLNAGQYVEGWTFQYSGAPQTLVPTGTGETKQWIMVKRVL